MIVPAVRLRFLESGDLPRTLPPVHTHAHRRLPGVCRALRVLSAEKSRGAQWLRCFPLDIPFLSATAFPCYAYVALSFPRALGDTFAPLMG